VPSSSALRKTCQAVVPIHGNKIVSVLENGFERTVLAWALRKKDACGAGHQGDADAELQEFSTNAFGSPQPALGRHASDEGDDIGSDARFAGTGRAAYPTPEETESRAMPSKHRLWFDQEQGMAPLRKNPREQHQQAALVAAKAGPFDAPRGDDELLPKKRVLGDQFAARTGQIDHEATRDARRTAHVVERTHRPGCQAGNHRGKPGAGDAEHPCDPSESESRSSSLVPQGILSERAAEEESSPHRAVPTATVVD
jgi:hypothetical protein